MADHQAPRDGVPIVRNHWALVLSTITSAGYALRRIHADDGRTLELLSARLAGQVTLPDTY